MVDLCINSRLDSRTKIAFAKYFRDVLVTEVATPPKVILLYQT
jgi:hypothetical protein